MAHLVRIDMLGEFRVMMGDRVITRFSTQKSAALLAYLAYHTVPHPRDVLVEIFWPDGLPEAGRASLSQALSTLRRQLEPPGVAAGGVIISNKSHVGLNPEAIQTDVDEFHKGLRKARLGVGRAERIHALQNTVELYRGELLPGFYEDWVQTEQSRVKEEYIHAVESLTALLVQDGDTSRAVEYARRAINLDELREESHQLVMRLCAAAGQPAAALEQYHALERTLSEAMGAEPSPASRRLAADIERMAEQPAGAKLPASNQRRKGSRTSLPRGTVTFLMTEIETANTPHESAGAKISQALNSYSRLLRNLFRKNHGREVREAGGSFLVAFEAATDAVSCAVEVQRAVSGVAGAPSELPAPGVRMALHTGEVKIEGGEYQGQTLRHSSHILTAVHACQIMCSNPTAALARADLPLGVHLVDLGVFRLRDVQAPEHLFQVNYDGMARTDFPAPRAEAGYQSNLPLQFTRFFGREEQLAQLGEMLKSAETRLVTITGSGGTGKTRLALETGNRMLEPFAGAVWFVPLVDLADPTLIAGAIIDALRVPRLPTTDPIDQAVELLKRQPALLILDNLEQFVDGAGKVVRTVLERVPLLTCLVTSRQSLAVSGEREYPLAPLATPNGDGTPERLSMFESVRLFVDRAQAVRPDFQVTNQNAPAVAELCDRLEGIPLAIELAAARASVFSPSQMLLGLERRFDFLVSRRRDAPARHETLRAAIDWSYNLLPTEIQQFFLRLSVFRGGWTIEAAEAVTESTVALDQLEHLRARSLVQSQETATGMRFQMLVTVREYAEQRLSSDLDEAARQRHLIYCVKLAEEGESHLSGPEQESWLARLHAEHDNFRAVLAFALAGMAGPPDAQYPIPSSDHGLRLAGALGPFWGKQGYLSEGRDWLRLALTHIATQQSTSVRAKGLNAAGTLARMQGDYSSAVALAKESMVISRDTGDMLQTAGSLFTLASEALARCDYASARALYEECILIQRDINNTSGIASCLNGMGSISAAQGDYATADELYRESLTIQRTTGNRSGIAVCLNSMGLLSADQADFTSARDLYEECLVIHRGIGDRFYIGSVLSNLGLVYTYQGNYATAQELYEESLEIQRAIGNRRGIAGSLSNLGIVCNDRGEYDAAIERYEEALVINRDLGNRAWEAINIGNLGIVCANQGDYAAARDFYNESLLIHREIGNRPGIASLLISLGNAYSDLGDYAAAIALFDESMIILKETGNRRKVAVLLNNYGNVLTKLGDYSSARPHYNEGISIRREIGDKKGVVESLEAFATLAGKQGQQVPAARLWGTAEAHRELLGAPIAPNNRENYDRQVEGARDKLGAEPFAVAWGEGREMTIDQAVEYALQEHA